MFCKNCGAPTKGEQTLCSKCAHQDTTPEIEVNTQTELPEQEQAPVTETPQPPVETFQLGIEPATPQKKKAGLIGGIIALAVVAAIAVVAIFCWDGISALWGRTVQSPEDYLADVESAAISEYSADLVAAYGEILEAYANPKNALRGKLQLTLDNTLLSLAETALTQQGMSMELDWLSKIDLSFDANIQDSAMQYVIGLGLGGKDLLSADVIFDVEDGKLYMTIPELNEDYVYTDVSYEVDPTELADMMSRINELSKDLARDLPSEKEMQDLIDTYTAIALSNIKDVEKDTETVEIGDASQKMVVLTATITQEDLLDIADEMLSKAKKDKTVKKLIEAISDYVNASNAINNSYYTEVDLYQAFIDSIPDALDSIEQAKQSANDGNYIELLVYVDMQNKVRGHELEVYTDGERSEETLSWLTATKGNTVYTEAKLDGIRIEGEKTENGKVSEGSYTLFVEGAEMITLAFADVTDTEGTLKFIPGEELMSQILSESGIPASLLGDHIALELSYAEESYSVNILVGTRTLMGLDVSGKAYDSGKISVPESNLDINDEYSLLQWLVDADFDAIVTALEQADVPAELVDTVRSYAQMLQFYMG